MPFIVKTRMMLAGGAKSHVTGPETAKAVFHQHGFRGLFRGAALRIVWSALGGGLYLGSYEIAKQWLKGGRTSHAIEL